MVRLKLAPWQFVAMMNPFTHFAMMGGVASGKTFTGAHFTIRMIEEHPDLPGFVGANSYDQLSQATLKELFYWLDEYGYEYVTDRRPPPSWKTLYTFKKYQNILTVRNPRTGKCTTIFTRVLSDPDALRGIQFAWYWLDESRDTPQNTHDVVLSRMRQSKTFMKGIITTTPNGEDWCYQRFVLNNRRGQRLYGAMHVQTIEAVRAGIIGQEYYDAMRASMSPLMAQQELDALHVNVKGGRAYYASGTRNARERAPWGALNPSPDRPLIIGCDFNYQPAPCVWMVGQVGPGGLVDPRDGIRFDEKIHWFGEISGVEMSTRDMTKALINQYPGFFYEVYGDASGKRGTTSNAGETDYNQMAEEFEEAGHLYTIDVDQNNPLVKDRVENMNTMFCNALGQVRQTYSKSRCPLFDSDTRQVGWKPLVGFSRQGRLDDGGDNQRTHATDGGGYAVFKKFPPGRRVALIESLASPFSMGFRGVELQL